MSAKNKATASVPPRVTNPIRTGPKPDGLRDQAVAAHQKSDQVDAAPAASPVATPEG